MLYSSKIQMKLCQELLLDFQEVSLTNSNLPLLLYIILFKNQKKTLSRFLMSEKLLWRFSAYFLKNHHQLKLKQLLLFFAQLVARVQLQKINETPIQVPYILMERSNPHQKSVNITNNVLLYNLVPQSEF
ncbi:hypothetical protein BU200_03390 [Streptococcus acidominimus]|uniref:Uncharacterized protein n=1 Tax=Streptococcus acidominimus TaxID=1326 RepID=A0A1Q8EEJ6_STRAI|nr:hypothetical protein BU200_03390 [Streptococcus acidominimus]SUN08410.1 Uncharacterised protein [Streptococcus acidominimus]